MQTLLLATSLTATSFLAPTLTEEQRLSKMRPYFYPPIGEYVEVDADAINNKKNKDPLDYVGYITVSPPKGVCFTITRQEDTEDEILCKKKRLAFSVKHLDDAGVLSWHISTGKGDFGADYKWPTPHRRGQVIKYGEKIPKFVPITRCIPQKSKEARRIILDMMSGERWVITFPPKDVSTGKEGKLPNLFVPSGGKKKAATAANDDAPPEAKDAVNPLDTYIETKFDDPVTTHWAMDELNSFVLPAANFRIGFDGPSGMNGSCRYRYTGMPKDPASGWMECHRTDLYDVILVPLSCMEKIKL